MKFRQATNTARSNVAVHLFRRSSRASLASLLLSSTMAEANGASPTGFGKFLKDSKLNFFEFLLLTGFWVAAIFVSSFVGLDTIMSARGFLFRLERTARRASQNQILSHASLRLFSAQASHRLPLFLTSPARARSSSR